MGAPPDSVRKALGMMSAGAAHSVEIEVEDEKRSCKWIFSSSIMRLVIDWKSCTDHALFCVPSSAAERERGSLSMILS